MDRDAFSCRARATRKRKCIAAQTARVQIGSSVRWPWMMHFSRKIPAIAMANQHFDSENRSREIYSFGMSTSERARYKEGTHAKYERLSRSSSATEFYRYMLTTATK